jgi:hypothetical protein
MASVQEQLKIPLPIDACYTAFMRAGLALGNGFMLIDSHPSSTLTWHRDKNLWHQGVTVRVDLFSVSGTETEAMIVGKSTQLGDLGGTLKKPMALLIDSVQVTLAALEHQLVIRMCPKCKLAVDDRTRFCPNDGTPIAHTCPTCNSIGGSQFCTNCGGNMS